MAEKPATTEWIRAGVAHFQDRIVTWAFWVAIGAALVTAYTLGSYNRAVTQQDADLVAMQNRLTLWQTYVMDLRSIMQTHGLEVPPPPEDE